MILNAEWQAQRQQRQQVTAQRQQAVQANLDRVRQELRAQATETRHGLGQFRDQLLQDGEQSKRLRLESRLQLQQETQAFLDSAREQRQTQATDVAQQLAAFAQSLQQQTTQFLAAAHAERSHLAQRLTQDLQRFHLNLSDEVSRLRQGFHTLLEEMGEDTEARRLDVHHRLHVIHQQRVLSHMRTTEALMTFVETLRLNVHDLLQQMTIDRQDQAVEVQQTLSHHRATRHANVQSLFENLAVFRDQLQKQRANLRAIVWDDASDSSNVESGVEPDQVVQSVVPRPLVVSVVSPPPASPQPTVVPPKPLTPGIPATIAAIPAIKPVVAEVKSAPIKPAPIESASIKPAPIESVPVKSAPTELAPSELDEITDVEKQVYNHLQQFQGARLVEIEAVVGLNRFQAVDALRSLMKRGWVMQRDRIYSIQEDITL